MLTLRLISDHDAETLSTRFLIPMEDVRRLIDESNAKSFHHRYFEMYSVFSDHLLVGTVSLYEHSSSVLSIGPEIFGEYRRRGYGTEAMKAAMNIAKSKGYKNVLQQIRTNNMPSIKMHTNLGFETDEYIYKNKNQHDILIYIKIM